MKIKVVIGSVVLGLLVVSCKPRTEHTIVQGYVRTYGSETTHEGIEIELRQDGSLPLDVTKSNADGWYQLEGDFEVNKRQYLFALNAPPLHQALDNQSFNNFEVSSGGIQRFDLEIHPYSWVNIHFKNINPCDQRDLIGFYGNLGGLEWIYGAEADTHFIWQTTGNKKVLFSYSLGKCGQDGGSFIDTVGYVAAFDTVDFQVLY
jgi:hypothetical protein